jgi:anti-sigma factor RsiW
VNAQDHQSFEDDLAAWMLGALEDREAKRFQRHLARCERCRTDLRWLRPAVDALPASVTQIAPPPRLRGHLLGVVRTEARRGAGPDRPRRGLARLAMPRPVIAALGAVALIGAGVAGYALRGGADSETLQANATPEAPGAHGELVVEGDEGTLNAGGMPRLDHNEVFQAWVREGGRIEPSTVFVPGRGGAASATIEGLEGADLVMVTREPRGGSTHPTTEPLLRARL